MSAPSDRGRVERMVQVAAIALALVIAILPLLSLGLATFKPSREFFSGNLLPDRWTLANYDQAFDNARLWTSLTNSVAVGLITTVTATVLGTMAAFSLSRLRYRWVILLTYAILAVRFYPKISGILPYYLMMRDFDLIDTVTAVAHRGHLDGDVLVERVPLRHHRDQHPREHAARTDLRLHLRQGDRPGTGRRGRHDRRGADCPVHPRHPATSRAWAHTRGGQGMSTAVAVVTGAAGLIGRQIVRSLRADGFDVNGLDRVTRDDQRDVVVVDVSDPDAVAAAAARLGARRGGLDALVDAAALTGRTAGRDLAAPLAGVPVDLWEDTLRVNLTSAQVCLQAYVPPLRRWASPAIVLIGSIPGIVPRMQTGAYAVSNTALIGLTHQLSAELAPDGGCPEFRGTRDILLVGPAFRKVTGVVLLIEGDEHLRPRGAPPALSPRPPSSPSDDKDSDVTEVMTVLGPVDDHALGVTLMHEHLLINEMIEERAIGLLHDEDLMRHELQVFADAGGGTVVELTTAELTSGAAADPTGRYGGVPSSGYAENGTREPNHVLALVELSRRTGLNLVLGAGHYRDPYLDRTFVDRRSVDQVAERIVEEATVGFAGTGVRAGIIGEVAADRWHVSAAEERSFRAAARAHLETGLTITTHAARWPVGIDQLDILTSEGVAPERVIIGHCDTVSIPEYHADLAERGVFVEFDTIRGTTELDTRRRVGYVLDLVRAGHLDQILLSHDNCSRTHLHAGGGQGFDYLVTGFTEELRRAGLDAGEIEQMLVANPRRALAG